MLNVQQKMILSCNSQLSVPILSSVYICMHALQLHQQLWKSWPFSTLSSFFPALLCQEYSTCYQMIVLNFFIMQLHNFQNWWTLKFTPTCLKSHWGHPGPVKQIKSVHEIPVTGNNKLVSRSFKRKFFLHLFNLVYTTFVMKIKAKQSNIHFENNKINLNKAQPEYAKLNNLWHKIDNNGFQKYIWNLEDKLWSFLGVLYHTSNKRCFHKKSWNQNLSWKLTSLIKNRNKSK